MIILIFGDLLMRHIINKYICTFDFQSNRGELIFFIIISNIILVLIIYLIFLLIFYKRYLEVERVSSYECGFNPNSSTRLNFSYRFFLISILFIIFDVEIVLLLPIPLVNIYISVL